MTKNDTKFGNFPQLRCCANWKDIPLVWQLLSSSSLTVILRGRAGYELIYITNEAVGRVGYYQLLLYSSLYKQFTVTRKMLTTVARDQSVQLKVAWFCRRNPSTFFKICFFVLLFNKSLNDWSLGKQWILFPSNLNVSLIFVSGNIEILRTQNSLFPSGPVTKCLISGKSENNNCFSKFSSNSLDFFGWNLLKSWHFLYRRRRENFFSDLQNFSTINSPSVFPYLVKLNDNGSYHGLREPIRKLENHYPELKIYLL